MRREKRSGGHQVLATGRQYKAYHPQSHPDFLMTKGDIGDTPLWSSKVVFSILYRCGELLMSGRVPNGVTAYARMLRALRPGPRANSRRGRRGMPQRILERLAESTRRGHDTCVGRAVEVFDESEADLTQSPRRKAVVVARRC